MNLLAIDTATEACSVALLSDTRLYFRHETTPRRQAEQVLPWIEAMLAEAGLRRGDLDGIAVGRGPGGFTGVRLAVAVAQGLAFGLDKPLLPVSSLAALAMQANAAAGERILAAIDARMGELYLGEFVMQTDGLVAPCANEWMTAVDAFAPADATPRHAIGSGFKAADGRLASEFRQHWSSVDAEGLPHASAIARLAARDLAAGASIRPEQLEPAYLRDKVARTLVERGVK